MKLRFLLCSALVWPLAFLTGSGPACAASDSDIPHLRQQGTATQLIVDGKPFVALAGELEDSTSTSLANLRRIWPALVQMNLNTVSPVVYWGLFEPEEGKFDFTLVDGAIQEARRNNQRIAFVWFASWKNGLSLYAPVWAKKDFQRFPRAQNRNGAAAEFFSAIEGYGDATRDADARAFAALMRHIKEVDSRQAHRHHAPGGERNGDVAGLPRLLARGQQGFRRAGAEGVDGLPSAAQGHPGSGVSPSVGHQRLQDLRHLGRGLRPKRGDG